MLDGTGFSKQLQKRARQPLGEKLPSGTRKARGLVTLKQKGNEAYESGLIQAP